MKASLDRFGRIVIPKKFRDDLGLEPGDTMDLEESEHGIFLKPEQESDELSVREGVLVYRAASTGNVDRALEETRNNRLDKFGFPV